MDDGFDNKLERALTPKKDLAWPKAWENMQQELADANEALQIMGIMKAEAEAERDKYRNDHHVVTSYLVEANIKADEALAEVARLRDALQFIKGSFGAN